MESKFNPPTDGEVYVCDIKETKDKEAKQVELRAERPVTAQENPLSYLMGGHSKFTQQNRKKVIFQNISNKNLEKWALKVGDNFSKACGLKATIRTIESLSPRVWKDPMTGKLCIQTPKTQGVNGLVLLKDNKPIYRSSRISFNNEPDMLILHNSAVAVELTDGKPNYPYSEDEVTKAIRTAIDRKVPGFSENDLAFLAAESESLDAGMELKVPQQS